MGSTHYKYGGKKKIDLQEQNKEPIKNIERRSGKGNDHNIAEVADNM